ncbi:MAG: hypothetical protein E6I33_04910, partial [Chloroflexi bacterium]
MGTQRSHVCEPRAPRGRAGVRGSRQRRACAVDRGARRVIGQDYWWVLLIKAVVVVLGLTTIAAYLTYAERKVAARIQLRLGPNRVGPFGLLQPAADAVKLLFKENAAPANRDRLLYLVGPSLAGGAAVLAFAVIPMGINN